jgi:sporulation protein YlmC with PRC-barrel domain
MDLPLDAEVRCTDGVCGRSTNIVFNPVTGQVTHIVVKSGDVEGGEYLVPIGVITESTPTLIQLQWTSTELTQAESFVKDVFLGEDEEAYLEDAGGSSGMAWPYFKADQEHLSDMLAAGFEQEEQIAPDELAIRRGAEVEATDGRVGTVDGFLVDSATSHITHLVLRAGHFWGHNDVTIPVSQIERVEENIVHLKLDKEAIKNLPTVAAQRK